MRNRKSIPIEGGRYIDERTAESILKLALGPRRGAFIGTDGVITHAMGSCLASLVAREMFANMSFLRDQVNCCYGEVMAETEFSLAKLHEHMNILLDLNLLVGCMVPSSVSTQIEKQSYLIRAFSTLPYQQIQAYNKSVMNVKCLLEKKILGEMWELIRQISHDGEKNWAGEIRSLLHERVSMTLHELHILLGKIGEDIGVLIERIEEDWERDLSQMRDCGVMRDGT
jgi:hypothetical protein